jgi:protoheme IX farnesyltransferase
LIKAYYRLTKPGIVYGNALTAAAGFLLASSGQIDISLLLAMLAGLSLVIASACVFNNFIDRNIDQKMSRTKNRALVSGQIAGSNALSFGSILLITGSVVLGLFTNWLSLGIALAAVFAYVVLYGIGKRRTVHGTLIGTIPGAAPPVIGYTAVTGRLDGGALLLFLILVFWQMPHFYAIAMYRLKDYQAAKLPVLPAVKGMRRTKLEILAYTAGFVLMVVLLSVFGYTGYVFAVIMAALGLYWLQRGLRGFSAKDDVRWGRQMFGFSLIVLLSLSIMLSVGSLLP